MSLHHNYRVITATYKRLANAIIKKTVRYLLYSCLMKLELRPLVR
jgi:DNA-binding NtrC family response regulator